MVKMKMMNIWGIGDKIGLGWRGTAPIFFFCYKDPNPSENIDFEIWISIFVRQLKRELGVLKASYVRMAALVGGEQEVLLLLLYVVQ